MPINITDELHAATTKGKIASAKEVFLTGDTENLQQIGEKTHQLEDSIKSIAVTGGASTAAAVIFDNAASGMAAVNAQAAIEELNTKNKTQDTEVAKKVDKTSIVQEFGESKDKVVSQFTLPFREIESPEFINCIVDSDNHILFGIQLDGSIEWGKGIPTPIKDKFQEIINQSRQDKTDMSETINTLNGILDKTTIKDETGVIQDTPFRIIENDEFLCAMVDAEDRILFGISKETGKPYYPLNDMYHVEQNEEFFAAWLDADNHLLLGIRRDGQIIGDINAVNALKQVVSAIQEKLDTIYSYTKELLDVFSLKENPEYLSVETDADGKILASTNADGSHYAHNLKSETIDAKVDKEKNKSLIDSGVAEAQRSIEDPEERLEVITDAEGKIISERYANGEKFESSLKTNRLTLSKNGMTEFQKALINNGFITPNACDWSDYNSNNGESPLQLPIPECAIINISNDNGDAVWPTDKVSDYIYTMEFSDMQGNYFKKNIIINAQGNSSMLMIKKNGAIDIFDNSVYDENGKKGKGNAFSIRFGNWVPQDSFHLKAFYNDFFKGCSFIVYQIADEVMRSYGIMKDRPWKRALIGDYEGTGQEGKMINDISLQIDNGARCMPDGFPCIVYLNGNFYGIYTFALKKHRDNYHMKKKEAKHIHLDGTSLNFFDGQIDWSSMEVRNPKDSEMCCTILKEGTQEYETYAEGKELLGDDATYYDPKNKAHVLSNKVKRSVENLSKRLTEAKALSTNEEKKAYLEKYFDIDSVLDYLLVATAVHDTDGGNANWQWVTYDGEKWFVCNYDKDRSFGNGSEYLIPAIKEGSWIYSFSPFTTFEELYSLELKEKWNAYVKAGIFTYENFIEKIKKWTQRIGQTNYEKEYKKWTEAPCNRDDKVDKENWTLLDRASGWYWWRSFKKGEFCYSLDDFKIYEALKPSKNIVVTNAEYWKEVTYEQNKEYQIGDICGYGFHFGEDYYVDNGLYVFMAISVTNTPPITGVYEHYPRIMGYRDNIWRVSNYIKQTLESMQNYINNL